MFSGSDVSALVHPDDSPLVQRLLDIAKERPEFTAKVTLLARNGQRWERHRFEVVHEVMGPILRFQPDHVDNEQHEPGTVGPVGRPSVVAWVQRAMDDSGPPGLAVMVVDIDRMKLHNDRLGGDGGDLLLRCVGQRIRAVVGESRCLAVGGDEFVVAIPVDPSAHVEVLAERLRAAVAGPVEICGQAVTVTCTVGFACTEFGIDADDLLRRAESALLAGKERGRNRVVRHTAKLAARVGEQVSAATQLHDALAHETLDLHYQPIHSIKTGAVVGVEAFLRIDQPVGATPVKAERLVEAAQDTGLIADLNRRLLDRLTTHLRSWEPHLGVNSEFHVSLNVSAAQILDHGFATELGVAIDRAGASPERICLELTETAMIGCGTTLTKTLTDLTTRGVVLGIDGLGSAGSSFADLSRFPVSFVKLRPSLIASLDHDHAIETIVETLIRITHQLGASTVAVGVERRAQHDLLARLGCDAVQGRLLHGSMPAPEITTLL